MIFPSYNSIWVLFTVCLLFAEEAAKADTSTSSSSSSSFDKNSGATSYAGIINGGEIGVNITYNSQIYPRMNVTLFYDTETDSATNFFQQQFTDVVFQGFTRCNIIDWYFYPCGTSSLDNNRRLNCPMGQAQCKFNEVHACIATLYADNQVLVGQFIICFFKNNENVDQCVNSIRGLVPNNINQCVSSKAGIADCGKFFIKIHGPGAQSVLGPQTGSASTDFTMDFKKLLCDYINNAKLTCNFCYTQGSSLSW